ncbi:MAG TPA: CRISPR-associated endonuclease Cas3'' [Candidatus Competibacteraceae bacterium]|nr:CRISPR-associated endonuclease Cas3'' [Candidatus Competibacteraceae bacterium]
MFYAHSTDSMNQDDWQLLSDHLNAVGRLTANFAERFAAQDMGLVAGLLHDLGKYTNEFQGRLTGDYGRMDHSTAGAKVAVEHFRLLHLGRVLAYCIAGHHAGLANGYDPGGRSALKERLAASIPNLLSAWREEIQLPDR